MSADVASTEAGTLPDAIKWKDEIDKKLCQGLAICRMVLDVEDVADTIKDSLWAVDDLIEDTIKGIDALYEPAMSAEKGLRP
jgi:hypothetical protein